MATISELLNQKIVKQLGGSTSPKYIDENGTENNSGMEIDVLKLKRALVEQAEAIRKESDDNILGDIFVEIEPETETNNSSKLMYQHPDVGGIEVIVDIDQLIPDMSDELIEKVVNLIKDMADTNNQKKSLDAYVALKNLGNSDTLNVLYIIFRKSVLFDFSHYTRDLLVTLVANLCAYNLKGRALLKGILNQSTVEKHVELALRSAGQIRAKEVLPEIFSIAKNEEKNHLIIICLEAIVNIRDTEAAIQFLPIISNLPDGNNRLIGQAIKVAKHFEVFEDSFIEHVYNELIQCKKRYLRPIYSEGLKSFGVRAIPILAEFMKSSDDHFHIRQCSKIIGGIKSPIASEQLRKLLVDLPHSQAEIIEGLAHTKDVENLPYLLECLQKTSRPHVKRTCIKAIADFGDISYAPALKKYLVDPETELEVIYALFRLGEKDADELFFDKMLNGTPHEQNRLENFTSLLPSKNLIQVAKKALMLPDMDSMILLSALLKPNVLPKQVGPLLNELLNREPKSTTPVRTSIYRIIGKFVGSEKELLGMDVLVKALRTEEPSVKKELENIISAVRSKGESGGIEKYKD
ncbi:HEAT repeat domain-containing protein [Ureibacillus acetophenoni]|uniref:HEAT repeat protein n=1 Tax=Ureibacillus acetophenoni TaxID=614649 RepID=A0A285U6R7_9BACL|nr:HEAT repeat domain-containing protein [Ureibacillus acetophenoni]SOC37088.1 hypothetical protein SAMN05877842_10319 [Ureibacillus acetophenoni]